MKISEIIKNIEKYNKEINSINNKIEIKDIPIDLIEKVKSQNQILDNLYNEFNMNNNSFIYKFSNTNDDKVKNIIFKKPMFISNVSLDVKNFIYDKLVKFKLTFYTIDNSVITTYMLPYEFRSDYIEEIKFSSGQTKSNFKTINNEIFIFYDIKKDSQSNVFLDRLTTDYHEYVDEEGYIHFNTTHKKDKLAIKYTPISSEFIRTINDKITSITLELDNIINNEIRLNISNI